MCLKVTQQDTMTEFEASIHPRHTLQFAGSGTLMNSSSHVNTLGSVGRDSARKKEAPLGPLAIRTFGRDQDIGLHDLSYKYGTGTSRNDDKTTV